MQTDHLLRRTLGSKLHQHGGQFGSSMLPGQLVHSVGFQKKGYESYTHPCSRAMSSELRVVASVAKLTMAASLSQANGLASIARAHPMVRCGSYGLATVARAHPMVRCGSGGLATVARAHPMVRCEIPSSYNFSKVRARSGDRKITQARVRAQSGDNRNCNWQLVAYSWQAASGTTAYSTGSATT